MPKSRPLAERFWEKVQKSADPNGCWVWIASLNTNGYGQINRSGETRQRPAHRLSWEMQSGPIPEGMQVCHHCDNQLCVRPDHLFLGTQLDNIRDMMSKGRRKQPDVGGEKNGRAKLSAGQVVQMRALWETGAWSLEALGRRFNVSGFATQRIVKGTGWRLKAATGD